jgi:hypothetical protein
MWGSSQIFVGYQGLAGASSLATGGSFSLIELGIAQHCPITIPVSINRKDRP